MKVLWPPTHLMMRPFLRMTWSVTLRRVKAMSSALLRCNGTWAKTGHELASAA